MDMLTSPTMVQLPQHMNASFKIVQFPQHMRDAVTEQRKLQERTVFGIHEKHMKRTIPTEDDCRSLAVVDPWSDRTECCGVVSKKGEDTVTDTRKALIIQLKRRAQEREVIDLTSTKPKYSRKRKREQAEEEFHTSPPLEEEFHTPPSRTTFYPEDMGFLSNDMPVDMPVGMTAEFLEEMGRVLFSEEDATLTSTQEKEDDWVHISDFHVY